MRREIRACSQVHELATTIGTVADRIFKWKKWM